MLFPSPEESDPIDVYRRLMRSARVDAFIVTSTNYDDPRIRLLMDEHFPFVAFGQSNPVWDLSLIHI